MSTIQCNIVSAENEIFSGEVAMVFATGIAGELGIAPRHAPLITLLKPGEVRIEMRDGSRQNYYVSGGILEVQPHIVTVLADTATRAEDIDEAAAIRAKEEAERLLKDSDKRQDLARVQADLAKAVAQIQALSRIKKKLQKKR
ncbi:MAG TPA: F0F1 ATP synthase subunit epsilon [Gammaproteobacteria bacterium]|nr:F0F1 ATP synthase subunit epsilon [Xanthomonadales bacterium]MCB1594751.1 F0F1 ATP synthase subunit epsilon [Xanthomonadales bacterium]HOP21900.1 F0F1 ATP synthase subunit epsilon [Gammaproteobacteria bacterium]HPI96258.1 F0F1 ATP synthase subunit epsilon [Gammaproteobacteria bacterium]HPQ87142.1 F0F1 ATP synthase subunit epsilon [Gammaproteobacteria bacterium]